MSVGDNLAAVRARIEAAAPDPSAVTLIAVSKTVSVDRIRLALAAGVTDLGENRVQEFTVKRRALGEARWHFIGTLQRNKVRDVVGRVDLIHSVDSLPLAIAIGVRATAIGARQDILLQVNVSGEASKHGFDPLRVRREAREVAAVEGVRVRGFMTIAAPGGATARAAFARLRSIRDALVPDLPDALELSMGMSQDLEIALAEGATMVRVGTAIFGSRPHPH